MGSSAESKPCSTADKLTGRPGLGKCKGCYWFSWGKNCIEGTLTSGRQVPEDARSDLSSGRTAPGDARSDLTHEEAETQKKQKKSENQMIIFTRHYFHTSQYI